MSSVLNSESLSPPALQDARLPVAYANAQKALAECSRIDECKTWSDKAAALASYARQAKDDNLRLMAIRIQARAERRCGELLKQIPRADEATRYGQVGAVPPVTRTQAATDAGLSERQRKTALRIASIPNDEFDAAVESASPPTVTKLAERGIQSRPTPRIHREDISPSQQAQAREAFHAVARFAALCKGQEPESFARAFCADDIAAIHEHTRIIDAWLDRLVTNLPSQ